MNSLNLLRNKYYISNGLCELSVWIQLIFVEIENWKHCNKIIFKYVNSIVDLWTVPFVPCTILKCDVTVHKQCLCPWHNTHMWYYCLCVKKKKKKSKRGFGNTDPNPPKLLLANWTSPAPYMFGLWRLHSKKKINK